MGALRWDVRRESRKREIQDREERSLTERRPHIVSLEITR